MKNLWKRLKAAWAVLTAERYMTIVGNGELIDMRRQMNMNDRDSIRYLTAWKCMITGGPKALDEANEILKNK